MRTFVTTIVLILCLLSHTAIYTCDADELIRVAVYQDSGVDPKAKFWFPPLLRSDSSIQWEHITCKQIQNGELNRFDVLIVPGGMSDTMDECLQKSGIKRVQEFIKSGKGYLGLCAGSYLMIKKGYVNAQTKTKSWWRGMTYIQIELSELGLQLFGEKFKGIRDVRYGNGPIVNINLDESEPPVEILSYFRSEITTGGAAPGIQLNSPAMLITTYGRGTIMFFSPHPEATPELNELILLSVHHLYKCSLNAKAAQSQQNTDPGSEQSINDPAASTSENQELDKLRQQAVDYMRAMATIEWTPREDIPWYDTPEKSVTPPSSDAPRADLTYNAPKKDPVFIYRAGETYKGIPYSQNGRWTNLERFQTLLQSQGGKSVYTGSTNPQQYSGSDCSSALSYAWRHVFTNVPVLRTADMEPGKYMIINPQNGLAEPLFLKVGKYKITDYDKGIAVAQENGKETMFNSYDQLLPGDALVTRPQGLVAMVTHVDRENKKVYIMIQCNLTDDKQLVNDRQSWRVDCERSYDQLFEEGYLPIRLRYFQDLSSFSF